MKLKVNGETIEAEVNTLSELLQSYDFVPEPRDEADEKGKSEDTSRVKGVAVAVNDAVVPKQQWRAYSLHENDRIEIVRAIQGG